MRTIDMTPSWQTTATILGLCLRDGKTEAAKQEAFAELVRMGELLDQLIEGESADGKICSHI